MFQLTAEQTAFIKNEFGIDLLPNRDINLNKEKLRQLHELCSGIEEEESIRCENDKELSKRGDMAVKIADILYGER